MVRSYAYKKYQKCKYLKTHTLIALSVQFLTRVYHFILMH
jgi:hypothetical protein